IHLLTGEAIDVREHQFLAATEQIEFTSSTVKGFKNLLFGGSGLLLDHFYCREGEGALWLHGFGNVFEALLQPGEQIDTEPGAWIHKARSVPLATTFTSLSPGLLGGSSMSLTRFPGPGRVAFQSMTCHEPKGKS